MKKTVQIRDHVIGPGKPTYIIAELSANHHQDFDQAVRLIKAAKDCGADAVKLQTYTPDSLTISCQKRYFKIKKNSLWGNRNLYDLYGEAFTPWEWQPKLKKKAEALGLDLFSSPFDDASVDFLEDMDVPAYKIASFELIDLPLLRKVARTGKPILLSTGMATLSEIDEAVQTLHQSRVREFALLKCTSAYPAPAEDMNLKTLPHLMSSFQRPVGLSDHSLGIAAPVAAVSLGACLIEKHFTLSRSHKGPDSAFSLEPAEFKAMVEAVRFTEKALGSVSYGTSTREKANRLFRRSLFVVKDVKKGDSFTKDNVRSIRPGHGLAPRHLADVLGRRASKRVTRGTPVNWTMIADPT